jgi:hypothetical protein
MRFLLSLGFSFALLGTVGSGQEKPQATRFCFISANDLVDASAPRFEKYPVKPSPPSSPAKLNLQSNPIAKTYRTVIRQQMREGANFAGHYRVAVWGCGTSCAQFAVVNLNTGRVITTDGIHNVSGVYFAADEFLPNTESEGGGFRFRKDSRLLVLLGAMNEDDSREGVFYYALKDEKLQLLHKTLATRQACEEHDPD